MNQCFSNFLIVVVEAAAIFLTILYPCGLFNLLENFNSIT